MTGRRVITVLVAAGLLSLAGIGLWQAAHLDPSTPNERVESVAASLRCPTCQGLSVADSAAPIAVSMRQIISEQLDAGRSPGEVRAYFVRRYGDWILLSPRASGIGWLVWALPVLGMLGLSIIAVKRKVSRDSSVTEDDLAHAEEVVLLHRRGRIALPQTPGGDRLEAALDVAANIPQSSDGTVRAEALHRVAGALEAQRQESAPPARATRAGLRLPVAGRGVAWAGGAAAFTLVLVTLLAVAVNPRGAGELPTGSLPEADRAAPGGLAELRDTVDRDPSDADQRLALASQLLLSGDPEGARAHVEVVLEQRPDDLDALLLRGLVMATVGEETGQQALRQFLATAPADHPGVPLARSLLDP